MTRDEVRDEIISLSGNHVLAELPTGFGKSKIALDYMKAILGRKKSPKILIVIPRLVLIQNWKEEFAKWGYSQYLQYVDFVTYVSLPKKNSTWDLVIFDEAHHLSSRCREFLKEAFDLENIRHSISLTATANRTIKASLLEVFPELHTYKVTTKQSIEEGILPDPRVYLIPLTLDNTRVDFEIIKNNTQKGEIVIPYWKRFEYAKVKNRKVIIKCTQRQYYDDLSSLIAWYKKKTFSEVFKNLFLRKSGERLKWLSEQKSSFIKILLAYLKARRTLTFCNGIPQTEELGQYCINSKNKASEENLRRFNEGKIDHITACNMLDEGMNLVNCQIGIYAVLNSSERMIKQKLGRLLRHPQPVIIIPYYVGTRDEELVKKMLEDYNPELVSTITSLTDLKL
jgi:superfamily II DNA or RNA helicase